MSQMTYQQRPEERTVIFLNPVEQVALRCHPCGTSSLAGNTCETSSLASFDFESDIDTSFSSRSGISPMAKALGQRLGECADEDDSLSISLKSTDSMMVNPSAHAYLPRSYNNASPTPLPQSRRRKNGRKNQQRKARPVYTPEEMAKMPCRFFSSKKGCQRVDCPYSHAH